MSNFNKVLARNTDNAPINKDLYSQTVAFSHYNNISAQLPVDVKTGEIVDGGIENQAKKCFDNIEAIIKSIDHQMTDIIRITIFINDIKHLEVVEKIYVSFFPTYLPTITTAVVSELPLNAMIQVEALISNGEGTIPNAKQAGDLIKLTNNTNKAPINSLSTQTVAFSHYNNISAQLPIDPQTGRLIIGNVKEQTKQCLKNIKTIMESIDVPFDDIVKVNLFFKNYADLESINEIYTTFFPDSGIARVVNYLPARTLIIVKDLPMQALVQIEVIVSHGDGTPPQAIEDRHGLVIEANNTDNAPICDFSSQTVAFSHYNHLSAQLPIDPKNNKLISGGIVEQTKQCLINIKAILESIDHKMEDIVKVNIFLKNIEDLNKITEVYKTFFPGGIPARRVIGVSKLSHDALIQIDVVVANEEGTPPIK
ncbi:MAG: Rid family hydrolase [Mycoplasmatales bacterium]